MPNSTRKRRSRNSSSRPGKPYDGFPLYAHSLGYWSKKVDGRILHFGRWGKVVNGKLQRLPYDEHWRAALRLFEARDSDARSGEVVEFVVREREPQNDAIDEIRLAELCSRFLTAKLRKMESGELSPRSFKEYKYATDLLIAEFGGRRLPSTLRPTHFEELRATMAKRWGPARLGKFVILVRSVFKYAVKNGFLPTPVLFGSEFEKPDDAVMRRHRAKQGKKLFSTDELHAILAALNGEEVSVVDKRTGKPKRLKAKVNFPLRAATLLAINSGLGNTDIGGLQFSHLNMKTGWIDYTRNKTGISRRSPLWKETLTAIKQAVKLRPSPKSDADTDCVFLNRGGRRMVQSTAASHSDYVSTQFRALLRLLGVNGRKGLGFYSLRHTFASIGLQTGDRDAVRALMGHVENDVLSHYDETGPSDERLRRVVDHVHDWLFAKGGAA